MCFQNTEKQEVHFHIYFKDFGILTEVFFSFLIQNIHDTVH